MRLEFDVCGHGSGLNSSFGIIDYRMQKFGRDDPLTDMFCRNLSNTIITTFQKIGSIDGSEELMTATAKSSMNRVISRKTHCKIVFDIWTESRNNRRMYFCKESNVSNDDSNVGTKNLLPFISRIMFGYATALKKSVPPKGFEALRGLNLIKGYQESEEYEKMIDIKDGKVGFSEEYMKAHEKEITEFRESYPEFFAEKSVDTKK